MRTGWKQRTLERMLERVIYVGISPEDSSPALRRYLASVANDSGRYFGRVYGEHVFVFARDMAGKDLSLITILNLPPHLRPIAHRDRQANRELQLH